MRCGLPGIGKFATARCWAERTRSLFPDGQIYIDFAALRDQAGGDVSEAVAMCLRALGVDDRYIPTTLAGRTARFGRSPPAAELDAQRRAS